MNFTLIYRTFLLRSLMTLKHKSQVRFCSVSNEPVKFSTSKASTWKAAYSRGVPEPGEEEPPCQSWSITLSLVAFLIYFCVLREENDIDESLKLTLYDRIEGLEEHQLKLSLKYNLEHGKDTKDIEARLKELESINSNNGEP